MLVALISKMVDLGYFDFVGNTLRGSTLSLQHPFFANWRFFFFSHLSFLFSLLLSSFLLPVLFSVSLPQCFVFFLLLSFCFVNSFTSTFFFCKSFFTSFLLPSSYLFFFLSFFLPPVFSLSLAVCNCWSSVAQRVCLCFSNMRTVGLGIVRKATA